MSDTVTHDEPTRETLEREAERAKARLLTTLHALDRRRHDAMDVTAQVKRHVVPAAALAAGVLFLVGGAVALSVHRAHERRRHRGRERLRALQRVWNHPERTAAYEPRSVLVEAARKALVATASLIAVELAKRVARSFAAPPRLRAAAPPPRA